MIVKELFAKLGLEVDEEAFAKGEAAIHGLHAGLFAFASAAAAGLALVGIELARHTAEAGDHVRKLAQSVGVDSIALQEFAYAAELADVSIDELAIGMRHLAKTGVKDVRGEMLKLAERFQTMPNDGEKVALAMEKFGRSGAKLIPLLNGGREELAKMTEEAHAFGLVISEEDQKASEEFNDELKRLHKSFTGIGYAIGLRLIRPLTRLVVWLREGVQRMRQLEVSAKAVTDAIKIFAAVALAGALVALVAHAGAIATAVSWYDALGVAALVNGARMAAAWLIGVAPVALLVLVIAALILAIEDVWVSLHGGKALIDELGPKLTKWLDSFSAVHGDDPWWLAAIRTAVRLLTDLQGTWEKVKKGFDLTFGTHTSAPAAYDATSPEAIAQRRKTFAAMGYAVSNLPAAGTTLGANEPLSTGVLMGGGASPAASQALHVTPTDVTYTPLKIDKIEVNATTGADAKQIANETRAAMEEHHKAKLREAQAGIE